MWQYGMPWWVFLTNCALHHSGGLSFLWIAFHGISMEGSYGHALDVMESCCFERQVFLLWWESCLAATKFWHARIVSASKCKTIKRWSLISSWWIYWYDPVEVYSNWQSVGRNLQEWQRKGDVATKRSWNSCVALFIWQLATHWWWLTKGFSILLLYLSHIYFISTTRLML
jgi:hypothetical protein